MLTVDEFKSDGKAKIEAFLLDVAFGAAYGYIFKLNSIGTAKIFAAMGVIISIGDTLSKVVTPKAYHQRFEAIYVQLSNIAKIHTLRHFGIIAKEGTIVMSLGALLSFALYIPSFYPTPNSSEAN